MGHALTKAELEKTHTLYDEFHDDWMFFIRSYMGGRFYRAGDYLIQHPLESPASYARRKQLAYFYNYCAPIVDILTAYLYRKAPERSYGSLSSEPSPPRIPITLFDAFWWNCDYEGASFDQFMRNAQRLASVYHRVSIIVDKPQASALTQAQALEQDIRPYLALVTPENLLDWSYIRLNGRLVLDQVKIKESGNLYRRWSRFGWELWGVSEDGKEVKLLDAGVHDLGEVPIVHLYNKKSGIRDLGLSDLQDIADINRNIYSICSDANEIIENSAFPMLTMPYEKGSGAEQEVGSKSILQFDPDNPNSRPAWLEPQHQSLAEIRNWIDRHCQEMARIAKMGGIRNTETSNQPWTGVAIEAQQDQLKSALVEKSDNAEQAELDILRLWAKWEGLKFEGVVKYPKEFTVRDLTITLQNAISALNANISSVTFEKERQKKVVAATLPELDEAVRDKINDEIEKNIDEAATGDKADLYEYHLKVKGGLIKKNGYRKRLRLPELKTDEGGEEFAVLDDGAQAPSEGGAAE